MWINTYSLDRHVFLGGCLRLESSCIQVNMVIWMRVGRKTNPTDLTSTHTHSLSLERFSSQATYGMISFIHPT